MSSATLQKGQLWERPVLEHLVRITRGTACEIYFPADLTDGTGRGFRLQNKRLPDFLLFNRETFTSAFIEAKHKNGYVNRRGQYSFSIDQPVIDDYIALSDDLGIDECRLYVWVEPRKPTSRCLPQAGVINARQLTPGMLVYFNNKWNTRRCKSYEVPVKMMTPVDITPW